MTQRHKYEADNVAEFVRDALGEIRRYMQEHGVTASGPPFFGA
jgi:hypothetical protein